MSAGWFADIDPEMDVFKWQPCLEMASGTISSLQIWFATEAECLYFIRTEALPVGALLGD